VWSTYSASNEVAPIECRRPKEEKKRSADDHEKEVGEGGGGGTGPIAAAGEVVTLKINVMIASTRPLSRLKEEVTLRLWDRFAKSRPGTYKCHVLRDDKEKVRYCGKENVAENEKRKRGKEKEKSSLYIKQNAMRRIHNAPKEITFSSCFLTMKTGSTIHFCS